MGLRQSIKNALPATVRRAIVGETEMPGGEKTADWYDRAFERDNNFEKHYTESAYYKIWTVILDRIRRSRNRAILEVGCGTGQLALAIDDAGLVDTYRGFDFSPKRIELAKRSAPELDFDEADAFATDLFDTFQYDLVLSTEFLEHVEGDLEVLDRIRPNAHFIGTVPSYPWESHVRHFDSAEDVRQRYASRFADFDILPLKKDRNGNVLYVIEGTKR